MTYRDALIAVKKVSESFVALGKLAEVLEKAAQAERWLGQAQVDADTAAKLLETRREELRNAGEALNATSREYDERRRQAEEQFRISVQELSERHRAQVEATEEEMRYRQNELTTLKAQIVAEEARLAEMKKAGVKELEDLRRRFDALMAQIKALVPEK